MNHPRVGIGVLIFNGSKLLLGERHGSHGANTWSPPGGHLEFGEAFEDCAKREVAEETGLHIVNPVFLTATNDIFVEENKHYVTLLFRTEFPASQTIQNLEPHKCAGWKWFDINALPEYLFLPLKNYLANTIKTD